MYVSRIWEWRSLEGWTSSKSKFPSYFHLSVIDQDDNFFRSSLCIKGLKSEGGVEWGIEEMQYPIQAAGGATCNSSPGEDNAGFLSSFTGRKPALKLLPPGHYHITS